MFRMEAIVICRSTLGSGTFLCGRGGAPVSMACLRMERRRSLGLAGTEPAQATVGGVLTRNGAALIRCRPSSDSAIDGSWP